MVKDLDLSLKEELDVLYPEKVQVLTHRINTRFNRRLGPVYRSDLPSMTQQQYAEECDLNNLVDKNMRFKDPAFLTKLQMFGSGERTEPIYGDFVDVPEFQNALNTINSATDQFMSLPSKIRARFDNDPVKLLEFVNNPDNYDEGLSLGIYKPRETQQKDEQIFVSAGVEGGNPIVSEVLPTSQPEKAGSDAVST